MTLKYTPKFKTNSAEITQAPDFNLLGVDVKHWSLNQIMGSQGLVVMFICNHCPYVKSIQNQLVVDVKQLQRLGINAVAIMSNDTADYVEDSFENMQIVADRFGFTFPYLIDSTQQVAKAYGAVCTPDFFGMNNQGVIKYRGRLNSAGINDSHDGLKKDLVAAMQEMVETGAIMSDQHPSMGCSIKWK